MVLGNLVIKDWTEIPKSVGGTRKENPQLATKDVPTEAKLSTTTTGGREKLQPRTEP